MINVLLAGVGGQGTVLAAKILAQAAQEKGWQVRTAETIGMAQRGGSVVSHVRMGNDGEAVCAPLVAKHSADLIVAFEPAEAARVLDYLAPSGMLACSTHPSQPVTVALSGNAYRAEEVLSKLQGALGNRFVAVNSDVILEELGSYLALNTVLLTAALNCGAIELTVDDLRQAISVCVKRKFVDFNLQACDSTLRHLASLPK